MTKNIAHRGYSEKYPENTMEAFQRALSVPGVNGIETDCQLTKDGVAVLIHDEKIDRTCTNGTGYVKDYSIAELKRFRFGRRSLFHRFQIPAGKRIVTLREYLELVHSYPIVTFLELKNSNIPYPGMEEIVRDLFREYGCLDRLNISSFNHESAARFKRICPEVPCGLLVKKAEAAPPSYVKEKGCDACHPLFSSLSEKMAAQYADAGIKLNVWTPNREKDIRKVVEWNVDAVISNCPEKVSRILAEKEERR